MIDTTYGQFRQDFKLTMEANLSADQKASLRNIFKPTEVKKDGFFIRQGEESTRIGYILKGAFRSFYIDEDGNDITKYFYVEYSMLFSYAAYLTHQKTAFYIQALEDSEILVASISDFEKILEGDYQLLLLSKKMLENVLVMKEQHASSFVLLNSVDRYKQFLIDYPGLEERVKQYQLASFLGISPVSLSRIRKKLRLIK